MEGDSPAEGEILMDDGMPADEDFPMDGELPDSQEAAMDEELPGPDETAMGDNVPASDSAITDGDMPEETSLSGENMEAEAETGNDSGMELQQEDTGEAPVEGDGVAAANANGPALELSSETGTEDGSGTGKNNPEVSAPPRRRKAKAAPAPKPEPPVRKTAPSTILTLNADSEVETPESREDTIWHELQNAYRTRKILTGNLGGIEKMDGGGTIAVIYYKDMRVVIPLSEMMINLVEDEAHDYGELVQRQNKILGNMLGCEIDFIIKGLENASRSVVASRKDAMYKKRQIFYMPDAAGNSRVCEDRIVQARVIAVAEKVVRVEIFGTECSILARDLSWDWLGDATERFHVGEQILVRILNVKIRSLEDISVKADVKSVNGNTSKDNLSKCKIQGKYAGTVTDVHKGTVFVRLHIGVNAVAHSCYDNRMPGKKDDVSFVVTRIDADRNVAVGLISRIIKQNI
ncbi:S1 RNA-binding domain-containing protein [Lachnospiraceae bacterium]|nr:S1 RNA-binding domain-containing protein [Lachnospiraceae bacterium]